MEEISNKSRLATTLFTWFLGIFGAHRFYLGKTGTALAMLFTLGGLGIWALVDIIMVISGNMRDTDAKLIQYWNPPASDTTTALPLAAGILSIVAGALNIWSGLIDVATTMIFARQFLLGFGLTGIPSIIFGVIAIIGGAFAIQRRNWVLGLIGAIFALLSTWWIGLLAIILIAFAKTEFDKVISQ